MQDNIRDDQKKVYEIAYLLLSSIPREKVADAAASLKNLITKKGAEMIGEEAPELIPLAYTMIKKIGTANHRFDEAFFGWMKFELSVSAIEDVKKALDLDGNVLRHLITITVRENTYLGKKSFAAPIAAADPVAEGIAPEAEVAAVKPSAEEIDKSIDEMVKGA